MDELLISFHAAEGRKATFAKGDQVWSLEVIGWAVIETFVDRQVQRTIEAVVIDGSELLTIRAYLDRLEPRYATRLVEIVSSRVQSSALDPHTPMNQGG